MKAFTNILLILIIVFVASTMPLFLSPIDYSSIITIPEDNEEDTLITFISKTGNKLSEPEVVDLEISTNLDVLLNRTSDPVLLMDVYKEGELIKSNQEIKLVDSLNLENDSYRLSNGSPLIISTKIGQKDLGLKNGSYRLVIRTGFTELTDKSVEITVQYSNDGIYVRSTNDTPSNLIGIPYYLSTEDDELVPVTEFVANNNSIHKLMEDAYLRESAIEGLYNPVGGINYIILRDSVIYIDIPGNDEVYNREDQKAENAYWAFVRPFSKIRGVVRVRFTVDNYVRESFFNGQNIRYSIPYENKNKLYMPILINERYFLNEKDIVDSNILSTDEIVDLMMEQIKSESSFEFSYAVEGQTLRLSIENYNTSQNIEVDKWDMLIESILYSVTSTDIINNLTIETFESGVENLGSYPVNKPITPKLYLNPIN
ncbi:MAG: Uncharacterized protein XD91_1818 [Clostridiales bacterium 38_11]|nr:MAG: Uncharacterized protein XD91_1818 [Clostridiales bacterium 38_11]